MLSGNLANRFSTYTSKHSRLYILGAMLFFWAIFDASFSYMVPIVVTESGYSKTFLGLILGSSSLFGAGLDLLLSKFLHNAHFRRMYLVMFGLCFFCPVLLFKGNPLFAFIGAMAIWGFYYDLMNFGNIDFVSRKAEPKDHSHSFGVIWVFRALGESIAPLIIGAVVSEVVDFKPYAVMWLFISIAFILFLILLHIDHHQPQIEYLSEKKVRKRHSLHQRQVWLKLGKALLPVLLLTTFIWIFDAFFWTIGPLMSESLHSLQLPDGFFLTLYTLPPVILGFLVGNVNKKLGKKRTARLSTYLACIALILFFVFPHPYFIIAGVLFAASFMAFSGPSLNGAYSDYITENPKLETEIEALQDFFTNTGYVIGPILAGFLADKVGNAHTFGYLGLIGIVVIAVSKLVTPKRIVIPELSR